MNAPRKYRKKPVVIDAMRMPDNYPEGNRDAWAIYDWIRENTQGAYNTNDESGEVPGSGVSIDASTGFLVIATLEGEMTAKPGDWIIRGVAGEFYPCKPEVFEATYEEADAGLLARPLPGRDEVIDLLKWNFWPFLSQDPVNPDRFWGLAADAVLELLKGQDR